MQSQIVDKRDAMPLDAYMEEFIENLPTGEGGAVLSFTGIVRADSFSDTGESKMTTGIEIECLPDIAATSLLNITAAIEQRPGIVKVVIIHFTGSFSIGDPLVHVFVCARHRQEGFKALEDVVNQYKKETPLWKKECYSDGSSLWIHY